jgi:hypothetical protein
MHRLENRKEIALRVESNRAAMIRVVRNHVVLGDGVRIGRGLNVTTEVTELTTLNAKRVVIAATVANANAGAGGAEDEVVGQSVAGLKAAATTAAGQAGRKQATAVKFVSATNDRSARRANSTRTARRIVKCGRRPTNFRKFKRT